MLGCIGEHDGPLPRHHRVLTSCILCNPCVLSQAFLLGVYKPEIPADAYAVEIPLQSLHNLSGGLVSPPKKGTAIGTDILGQSTN